jgi:hypothetical protein
LIEEGVRFKSVFELPEPDSGFLAADVKDVAADVIGQLPLRGIEGYSQEFGTTDFVHETSG